MKSILYGEAKPSPKAEVARSNRAGCTNKIKGLQGFVFLNLAIFTRNSHADCRYLGIWRHHSRRSIFA